MKQFFEIEEEVEKKSFFNLKENNETKVPDWINDLSLLKSRYDDLKYKLDKGDAIMFPSNFMYPHEIMPVTKGTRYSAITWFI